MSCMFVACHCDHSSTAVNYHYSLNLVLSFASRYSGMNPYICISTLFYRPINTLQNVTLYFEHYMHPCLSSNTTALPISRVLLPLGLQGFEISVSNAFETDSLTGNSE